MFGGPDSPEVQETQWFNSNYPGWVGHAKTDYSEMISQAIEAQCGKKRLPNMPRMPVYPHYSDTCLCSRTAGGGNETDYGDKPQSRFSADKVLGSFVFMIEGPVRVSFSDDSSLCCPNGGKMKHYRWDADLIVYDVLGFQSEDLGYWISLGACPERGLVRARWKLNGAGVCCTTPKP